MRKKNCWILLGLIVAMVLVFAQITQAKEEQVSLVNPVLKLDELGRFQAFNREGGVFLVDSKTGRTWIYRRGYWLSSPFIEGQPFPGNGKLSIISPDKNEKDE